MRRPRARGRRSFLRLIALVAVLTCAIAVAKCERARLHRPTTPPPESGGNTGGTRPPERPGGELSWELDVFDVGTGLSLLVRGQDFSLLYDGGSNDDRATGRDSRLLAYLRGAIGASGGAACTPRGDGADARGEDNAHDEQRELTHVVLSHPHRDHVGLLPDVLRCYAVREVWDSGANVAESSSGGESAVSDVYREFLAAVAQEPGVVYHTAQPHPGRRAERTPRQGPVPRAATVFHDGDRIELGRGAHATILNARFDALDLNDDSIVLRIDLGRASLLLTGDATGGDRSAHGDEPAQRSVEHHLLKKHRREIDVDVLQVGHHGSRTSSRGRFLDAVTPSWAIVSSGPTRYGDVTLPDAAVIDALEQRGSRVLRTDVEDERCRQQREKVGRDADGRPGGCNGARLRIWESGKIEQEALERWEAK